MGKDQKKTNALKNDTPEKVNTEAGVEASVPMPPSVTYPIEEINKVVNYLGSRPYAEVVDLIRIMQSGKSS